MSRTKKNNGIPRGWGGFWWRDPDRPWRYFPGPPRWFRRIFNQRIRRIQNREVQAGGEVVTPRLRDVRWRWW